MKNISESQAPGKQAGARPRLRNLEAFSARLEGRDVLGLRDPGRVVEHVLFFPPAAGLVFSFFDGAHTLEQVRHEVLELSGQEIQLEVIATLADQLDEHLFLENERFAAHERLVAGQFAAARERQAFLAGQAYPETPQELSALLASYGSAPKQPEPPPTRPLAALAAPHIDFNRGGSCYAQAYARLAAAPAPDLVVVLGTAHVACAGFFVPLDKDFATPLGLAACERNLTTGLIEELGSRPDEMIHRGEHSVEFQAVWLKHVFSGLDVPILPIICGSLAPLAAQGRRPLEDEDYVRELGAVRRALEGYAATGRSITIIASVDLSHVGPLFGHERPVTPECAEEVRRFDHHIIGAALAGDAEGFYEPFLSQGAEFNVCGLGALYALLSLIRPARGKLLAYDQWIGEGGEGLVSFAALGFE